MSNTSKLAPKSPAAGSVQKKSNEASSSGDAMKVQLRGMDYNEGAAALAPGGAPVQMIKGAIDPNKKKKDKKDDGDGTNGGGGG